MRTLIRGGMVVDGTGAPPRYADVLVSGDRITALIEPGTDVPDARVLDVAERLVCPGFVDVHSHADNSPLLDFDDRAKIMQGVTTEIVGNCGFSLAPAPRGRTAEFEEYLRRLFPSTPVRWASFAGFTEHIDAAGSVTNYCPLVGHGALRYSVIGMAQDADRAALRAMRSALDEALEAGAFGLSTGLVYPPGSYAPPEEIRFLAETLQDRVYATHQRAEGAHLMESLAEALAVARHTRYRLQVSHLKAMGRPNWGRTRDALDAIDRATADGAAVAQDVYPYTAASTTLMSLLPPEFLVGTTADVLDRLGRDGATERLRSLLATGVPGWENRAAYAGWDGVLIAHAASGENQGSTLGHVARKYDQDPVETLVSLLLRERLEISVSTFLMDEGDIETVLEHPRTMIGSDGLPVGASARPHPRLYGTFPRVLGSYTGEDRPLALSEAIRRMTSLPAEWFHVPERGRIEPGLVADLVVVDPDTVRDTATYEEPEQYPVGVESVLVAGHVVVERGTYTGGRRGRRLIPA